MHLLRETGCICFQGVETTRVEPMLNSQARRRCSLVRTTLNTTLPEDPREVLFPGLMGKQTASFLSARGVLGSFQKKSAPSGNTHPLVEAVHRPRFSGTRKHKSSPVLPH